MLYLGGIVPREIVGLYESIYQCKDKYKPRQNKNRVQEQSVD